jgi:hypothetical protein
MQAWATTCTQAGCRVRRCAIDVNMRTELPCEWRIPRPASHSRHAVAELLRELNSQMTKTADPLDGDQIAWERTAMA